MSSELHRIEVYDSVELLLLVSMLFLLAIPKSPFIFKGNFITLVCTLFTYPNDCAIILELTYTPFLSLSRRGVECMAQLHMHKCNKMAALGYVNTWEHKLRTRYSVVPIGFSPALRSWSLVSVCESSYTTWVRRCPVLCCRSAQKFSMKEDMKRQNGVLYEQPMLLSSYMYSRLALGVMPSSIHQKKPIHGLPLLLAVAVWLVTPSVLVH